jgi:acyl transferase domain-containing protein
VFLPSLSRGRDDWRQMLAAVGGLFVNGVDPDWNGFERDYPRRTRVALPTYPFERDRYWLSDTPAAGATRRGSSSA